MSRSGLGLFERGARGKNPKRNSVLWNFLGGDICRVVVESACDAGNSSDNGAGGSAGGSAGDSADDGAGGSAGDSADDGGAVDSSERTRLSGGSSQIAIMVAKRNPLTNNASMLQH